MLSERQKLNEKKRLAALPLLERPRTVRLKFKKVGSLQYISHLDLQRTFNRVITRACLPVWYTKGFNPHAKLVFSTPLSVGAQSVYEFLDIRIDREFSCDEIKERMNRELTDELTILDAYIPDSDFSEIAWAAYTVEIHSCGLDEQKVKEIDRALKTSPLMLTKKTKAGEKEIDIVPLIHSVESKLDETEGILTLSVVLRATTGEYLNPELMITGLKQKTGILSGDPMEEWYSIMRTSTMKEDFSLFV